MKAFWWFEENAIAGMARPGFNGTRWFEFSFEEAVLVGWIGQLSSGSASMQAFQTHLEVYVPKIRQFYGLDADAASQAVKVFSDPGHLRSVFNRVMERSKLFESYEISGNEIHFSFCRQSLDREIEALKQKGVRHVVSLTESHHNGDELRSHFNAHHFSINDLDAPKPEQVRELANILREAKAKREVVAVHCLAGIGRTSTMIMGAHMMMGESLAELKEKIARQNPVFVFTGRQAAFLESLAASP